MVKYCSDRCRSRKPGPQDRKTERAIVALLQGEADSGIENTAAKSRIVKGDARLVVTCDEIEEAVFGSRFDPEKVYGRRKNRKKRWIGDPDAQWKSVDMEDSQTEQSGEESQDEAQDEAQDEDDIEDDVGSVPFTDGGPRIRPPQDQADVNFSVGGERGRAEKIEESADDLEKRRQGAKRAEEREMIRRAARRGIVFGFEVPKRETLGNKSKTKAKGRGREDERDDAQVPSTEIRKCEALMNGMVVEPSFAKGNWAIRWRE